MRELWSYLKSAKKPILIYGMGNGADKVLDRLERDGAAAAGVFASDGFVRGQSFRGFTVISYAAAKERFGSFIVLVAFGSGRAEVLENVARIAAEQELYVPDVPAYGETFFDAPFYESIAERLSAMRSRLADERSRQVLDAVVEAKLGGSYERLMSSADDEDDFRRELLDLRAGERLFDLGAYRGDTAERFLAVQPQLGSLIAVEPDRRNFAKLTAAFGDDERVICVRAAVWEHDGLSHFTDSSGRNQHVAGSGSAVDTVTVDTLSNRFGAPDVIKFDIEGAELAAINGARNTIKNTKPRLYLSAYHRSGDIVALPEAVLALRPDYRVYLRRGKCLPCWDMYFIFV